MFTANGQARAADSQKVIPVVLIHVVVAANIRRTKENGNYAFGQGYPSDLLKGIHGTR